MDKNMRNAIERATQRARELLEGNFAAQLVGDFDVHRGGAVAAKAGSHLTARQAFQRDRILAAIEHKRAAGMSAADSVADYLRDAAFTTLNRFVALKMLEARGLVQECISKGEQSAGYLEFCGMAPGLPLLPDSSGYRLYIECLFDELSTGLKVLFNRGDPSSVLWPRRACFEELLRTLNAADLATVWSEDETIGWLYQYYNSADERKAMRKESSAPRNSREMAVRNQFFTPRYVVEFLTDNTLGRLWYEMTRGETDLRDLCRYLVRRSTEIFLKPGESAPASAAGTDAKATENLSQEELPRQPVHISYRPLKDPREIRLLDPACGSMHFGLYAFDLFTVIYDEAWEIAQGGNNVGKSAETFAPFVPFAATFSNKAAFLCEVPRLVVEHNLHGIDIDPRAAQIAGLSVWLRAQRAWHKSGVKLADRPRITRSNLVCAEQMPGERELLREFVEQQFPAGERPAFAFLLEKIFDRMTLAGEAGSLLRIEEEIRTAIAEARAVAQSQSAPRQAGLFPADDRPEQAELDLRGLNDERFWQAAEQRIYDALEAYAEQAENGGGFRRRLFADDAARGFAFIDVCRRRYDVVVMNPPFGEQTEAVKAYLGKEYPRTKNNLYCAFVERVYELCPAGIVGLISARTFVMYREFEDFRKEFLLNSARIEAFADLGWGVLDGAQVETAAFVLARRAADTGSAEALIGPFIKLLSVGLEEKGEMLLRVCHDPSADNDVFYVRPDQFSALPGSPLAYWASPKLVKLFSQSATFEPSLAYCGRGAAAHVFFFRLAWEIPADQSTTLNWCRLAHGGEYSPFFRENSLFIYWNDSGRQVKEYILKQYPYLKGNFGWAIQDEDKYGRVGLTSGKRNERFNVQLMPAGHIFTNEGQGFIPNRIEDVWFCLGYLNSSLVSYFLALTSGLQKTWVYIRPVPVVSLDSRTRQIVERAARESFEQKRTWTTGAEEAAWFICPWALRGGAKETIADGVRHLLQRHAEDSEALNQRRINLSNAILVAIELDPHDEAEVLADFRRHPADVAFPPWRDNGAAEISGELAARIASYLVGVAFGRWDIRYATGERPAPELPDPLAPLPVCPPGMLRGDDGLPLSTEAGRRQRAEGRYPLDVAWDGILVDDPEDPLDIERRILWALQAIWPEKTDSIVQEVCELLGVRSLRDWFCRPVGFFADHLKRYSKGRRQAPIYWPLSTASGRYTLWLYFHRFAKDTPYRCLEIVKEKLKHEEARLARLTAEFGGRPDARQRKDLDSQETFVAELRGFHEELVRVAPLWRPNLNDGVIVNYAPLWRVIAHKPWQKTVRDCWEELAAGEYDWAHLAMHLWPERVVHKCVSDRSLAIAHGLEADFWVEGSDGKWTARKPPMRTIDELVRERTSPAVKSALKSLLGAPAAKGSGGRGRGGRRRSAAAAEGGEA